MTNDETLITFTRKRWADASVLNFKFFTSVSTIGGGGGEFKVVYNML